MCICLSRKQLELQLQTAQSGKEIFRVTAMFSATMPPQVEQIAKTYLRHPVCIRIGNVLLLLLLLLLLLCIHSKFWHVVE